MINNYIYRNHHQGRLGLKPSVAWFLNYKYEIIIGAVVLAHLGCCRSAK